MIDGALRGKLRVGEAPARHTSWRAGGQATRRYPPADRADLIAFVAGLDPDEPLLGRGLGSNLLIDLVRDEVERISGIRLIPELRRVGGFEA
jgi:UDP-N-acetylenolpyruvoylglucosamine reductase